MLTARHRRSRPSGAAVGRLVLAAGLAALGPAWWLRAWAASTPTPVTIAHYQFMPAAVTVAAGDTITWTNQDDAPHTVTSSGGPATLDSPQLDKGQSWSYTFTRTGTYNYYCAVHPDMKASVTVAPSPPATTAPVAAGAVAPATAGPPALPLSHPVSPPVARPAGRLSATSPPPGLPASTPTASTPTTAAVVRDDPVPIQAVTTTTGPTINPLLILAATATAVAVFGVVMLGRPARHPEEPSP